MVYQKEVMTTRTVQVRDDLHAPPYESITPTYDRLPYWAKLVRMADEHYRRLIRNNTDKNRRLFKAGKHDVYFVALLDVPLFNGDIRLPNYPITQHKVMELVRLVRDAYQESVGLLESKNNFPTYTSATVEMSVCCKNLETTIVALAEGEKTIAEVLEVMQQTLEPNHEV